MNRKFQKGWRDLLSTGDYLESGWFVSFAKSEVPKPNFDELNLSRHNSDILLEFGGQSWRIIADKLTGLSFMGAKIVDQTVFLFFEDEQEAWAYYCAKVDHNRLHWLTKIQSYWILPEGGNFYVEPTIEGNMLLVYCALPTSVAINHIDVRTGQMMATFSSRWVDLSFIDLQ